MHDRRVPTLITRRPLRLARSFLFVPGADEVALAAAPGSGADVLIQELEDFTPPPLRSTARAFALELYGSWRAAGKFAAVRVNPLAGEGLDDLAAVMRGRPDIVALPKVAGPADIASLATAVQGFERDYGIPPGSTRLLPNIELARGLVRLSEIARASERSEAMLLATEDLAADLGAERSRDGSELAYPRQRFLVECVAAGVIAVDCPYTFSDAEGVARDTLWARRLGYKAKSAVAPEHASTINSVMTPEPAEVARARAIVAAFEAARSRGEPRVEFDGLLIEMPTYATAQRLIARAEDLELG